MFALKLLSRFIITFLLFLLLFQTVKAQEPARLISTLNNGGSSNTITIDSRKYYFQQSIGQSGIIGLSGGKKQILRQGFIQPPAGTVKNNLTENLPVEIYPNPFTTSIILSCPEKVSENLYVTIYDLNGKIVYLKKFGTSRELNLDLSDLTPSIYILRVNTTTRWFFSKVIKLPN